MRSFVPVAAICSLITFATSIPSAPAEAGQFTLRIAPHGHDAQALRRGLQLYSIFNGFKNHAKVRQNGNDNAAAIGQYGSGDVAAVFQQGSGNSGGVVQRGNNDAFALFQFGKNNASSTQQNSDGQVGIVLQGGW